MASSLAKSASLPQRKLAKHPSSSATCLRDSTALESVNPTFSLFCSAARLLNFLLLSQNLAKFWGAANATSAETLSSFQEKYTLYSDCSPIQTTLGRSSLVFFHRRTASRSSASSPSGESRQKEVSLSFPVNAVTKPEAQVFWWCFAQIKSSKQVKTHPTKQMSKGCTLSAYCTWLSIPQPVYDMRYTNKNLDTPPQNLKMIWSLNLF